MKLKMFLFVTVISAALNAESVLQAGNLVTNGGFEGPPSQPAYGDHNYHSKERFSEIKPYGWSGGNNLTYLSFPGFGPSGYQIMGERVCSNNNNGPGNRRAAR